ncbi:hypothetical protein [Aeoliella sp.]|uniref:hypothetical protein n=1 Tax=Aeoliella sp. TaxID=2795800 RepID=UPI003CCBDC8A
METRKENIRLCVAPDGCELVDWYEPQELNGQTVSKHVGYRFTKVDAQHLPKVFVLDQQELERIGTMLKWFEQSNELGLLEHLRLSKEATDEDLLLEDNEN